MALKRQGAVIVNTARGGLGDEEALADVLDRGRTGGAGLDLSVDEPPSGHLRLLRSDRVVVSPHSAGLTEECVARMGEVAARNILDFFDGDRVTLLTEKAIPRNKTTAHGGLPC